MSDPALHPRLVLVEGTIGAGKTTTARALTDALTTRGHQVHLVLEGSEDNPADVDDATYDLPLAEHTAVRLAAWDAFVARAAQHSGVWVLDCAVVQNPVTVGFVRDGDADGAAALVRALVDRAAALRPVLVHLEVADTGAAFEAVVAERPDWWLEHVVRYYADGAPGRALVAAGADERAATLGVLAQRSALERRLVDSLPCAVVRAGAGEAVARVVEHVLGVGGRATAAVPSA